MNRMWCEREADVVRSLRMGSFSVELCDHVESCVVCAETGRAAGVMLQAAALLRAEDGVPPASLVWSRAQAQRQEVGLKRATRPLMAMRVLSVVYVILCAAWALRFVWRSVSMELEFGWDAFGGGSVGFGMASVLVVIAIGAWYLLYDSARSETGIPSST